METQYDIFISYSRKDTDVADDICRALDRAGISYFIDRQDNPDDLEIPATLANAIVGSRIFLLLASENSYASKFVDAEITFAFNKLPRRSIVPYIIDGSELPLSMRFMFSAINWRDRRTHPIEPKLMADLCGILGRTTSVKCRDIDFDSTEYFEIGRGHTGGVSALAITRSGDMAASGAKDGTVCIWDLFMGEQKGDAIKYDGDEVTAISFNPSGSLLTVSGYNGTELWDTESRELLHRFKGDNAVFSPDGSRIAVSEKISVNIYSAEDYELLHSIEMPITEQYNSINALLFTPDGRGIAAGSMMGRIWLRDCETGGNIIEEECLTIDGYRYVSSMAVYPDGKMLMASSSPGVTCWRLPKGHKTLFPSDDVVESVSASPDKRYFATADYIGAFKIYDRVRNELVFERRLANAERVLYSPDGEFVLSGDCFGSVALWSLKSR